MTRAWHIVTGEFPPAHGGVSDYTRIVAAGLAAAGEAVHVWCPGAEGSVADPPGVVVHRVAGAWTRGDFRAIDVELDAMPGPRHLLVQWVPHAYGRRSMNVGFCRWIRRRARAGDVVDLMVHEPFLAFGEGAWRHDVMACVHRVMAAMLLGVTRRAWVSIPAWADQLRPWARGTVPSFCWLPVPSTLTVSHDVIEVARIRSAVRGGSDLVIGHFSTYDVHMRPLLEQLVPRLLRAVPNARMLLLGRGSDVAAGTLGALVPGMRDRIRGAGPLDAETLSAHLQACDLMVQPYVDGASTRRSTLMAALSHGVPVVTTAGRLSEPFWQSSSAVVCVSAGDIDGLVQAASTLAADPGRRRSQSAMARDTYAARFAVSHVIDALRQDRCGPEWRVAAQPATAE